MKVIIYQTPKSAMQSGKKKIGQWHVRFHEDHKIRSKDPLMNWTSADSTLPQIDLVFATKDLAKSFAVEKGYDYEIRELKNSKKIIKKSYAANFTKPVLD